MSILKILIIKHKTINIIKHIFIYIYAYSAVKKLLPRLKFRNFLRTFFNIVHCMKSDFVVDHSNILIESAGKNGPKLCTCVRFLVFKVSIMQSSGVKRYFSNVTDIMQFCKERQVKNHIQCETFKWELFGCSYC